MKTWAVANQKGGVGKTTTAVTLGGLLAQQGHKTVLIDTDPHGSMTSYFRYNPDALEASVYSLFENSDVDPFSIIKSTRIENLDILPASMALATLDRQLGTQSGMGLVLFKALKALSEEYDYAIIDCPPMLGVLMVNALAACDHLILPSQTEFLAIKGLERMLRTLKMIVRSRNIDLPYTIVPTLYDKRTRASNETLRLLRTRYSDRLWKYVIPIDTQFREASRKGVPLPYLMPEARGARAYNRLLKTLTNQTQVEKQAVTL